MFRHHQGAVARKMWPRLFWPAALLLATALLLLWPANHNTAHAVSISAAQASTTGTSYKVPVTLFVMSRCPDARFCQTAFKPIVETLPSVIQLQTRYIATLKDDESVQCMHGQIECDGNKQQLCMQQYVLPADNRKFLAALLCHGAGNVADPEHLKTCMTQAGIAAGVQDKVLQCISGTQGSALQADSAKEVAVKEVVKSCTVYIEDNRRCIRDGGMWYDCPGGSEAQDFIKSICDAFKTKTGADAAECKAALGQGVSATQTVDKAA